MLPIIRVDMRMKKLLTVLALAWLLSFGWLPSGMIASTAQFSPIKIASPPTAWAAEKGKPADIKWFKDQLGLAPKYQARSEGVLGMSWPHFLVMTFLVVFFLIALIAVYVRNRRTRQLLMQLVREKQNESEG